VRGRGTRLRDPRSACLNCGDTTPGEYCAACGQRKTEVLVSLRAMIADALEDEFVLNRRLPRTIGNLLFRPGFLTLEHVNGRIVRYVRPFKLYLVSSVIFFLLLSFFSLRMISRAEIGGPGPGGDASVDTMSVASIDSALAGLRAATEDGSVPIAGQVAIGPSMDRLELERRRTIAAREGPAGDSLTGDSVDVPGVGTPGQTRRTLGEMLDGGEVNMRTGSARLDEAVRRRIDSLMQMTPRQAAERLVGDFLNYIPTMMFVLLPFFALVLKLLYLRRRRYYAEHFVFLLHVHSFVYLLFALMLLVRGVFSLPAWLLAAMLVWTVLYIFLAMKRVYAQGWFTTIVKGSVLGWTYAAMLVISIPVGLLLSFLLL
jgi:hypothetical protein